MALAINVIVRGTLEKLMRKRKLDTGQGFSAQAREALIQHYRKQFPAQA